MPGNTFRKMVSSENIVFYLFEIFFYHFRIINVTVPAFSWKFFVGVTNNVFYRSQGKNSGIWFPLKAKIVVSINSDIERKKFGQLSETFPVRFSDLNCTCSRDNFEEKLTVLDKLSFFVGFIYEMKCSRHFLKVFWSDLSEINSKSP